MSIKTNRINILEMETEAKLWHKMSHQNIVSQVLKLPNLKMFDLWREQREFQ
jgi:hypothetical protein